MAADAKLAPQQSPSSEDNSHPSALNAPIPTLTDSIYDFNNSTYYNPFFQNKT